MLGHMDLAKLELDAKATASKHVANMLQRPDQLEKVDQFKRRVARKKASVETMLKTAMQSQLDGVKIGLQQLQTAQQDIQEIKNGLKEVENAYVSVAHLSKQLEELRRESVKHTQYAAAVQNLKHIVNVPENVERARHAISEGQLLLAHKYVNDLETSRNGLLFELHKQQSQSPTDRNFIKQYFADVDNLSDELGKQIWIVVGRTLTCVRKEPQIIVTALRIIEREEMKDAFYQKRQDQTGFLAPGRPKKWRQKCFSVLEQAVATRIEANQFEDRSTNKMWLVRHLEVTRLLLIEDLKVVKTLCEPCFPPHYDIVNRYVKLYHDCLSEHLQELVSAELEGNEIITLLNWVNSYSGVELMKHPQLMLDTSQLVPLLENKIIDSLINKYVETLDANIGEWIQNTLRAEVKDWNRNETPEADSDGYFQTPVPVILFQMVEQHMQVAGQIGDDMMCRVLSLCINKVIEFSQLIKAAASDYKQKHHSGRKQKKVPEDQTDHIPVNEFYVHYLIAIINNCQAFCDLATKLPHRYAQLPASGSTIKMSVDRLLNSFQDVANACCGFLVEEVFLDVDALVQDLMTTRWQTTNSAIDTICITIEDYSNDFVHVKKTYYMHVMNIIERCLICEYIKAMMQKKVTYKAYEERKLVADKIVNEANQMENLFDRLAHSSEKEQVCEVLRQLTELLSLKDTSMLSLEICGLASKFPDITVDQLASILALRGDLGKSESRQLVIDSIPDESQLSSKKTVFSDVPSPEGLLKKLGFSSSPDPPRT